MGARSRSLSHEFLVRTLEEYEPGITLLVYNKTPQPEGTRPGVDTPWPRALVARRSNGLRGIIEFEMETTQHDALDLGVFLHSLGIAPGEFWLVYRRMKADLGSIRPRGARLPRA